MQHSGKTYFPNLDASRFFAFLPVFFTHVFFTKDPEISNTAVYRFIENHMKVGILGLDYFFVLSSFLITWVILEEYSNTGIFSFKNYFIRRSLRIWPLYFLIVTATYTAGYFFTFSQLPPIIVYLLFVSNFYIIEHGDAFLFLLVILWSVSVEEQFYLLWAVLLKFFKKYLVPVSIAMIVISVLFRSHVISEQKVLYFHTLSTLANFAIGALCAHVGRSKNAIFQFLKSIPKAQVASIYFLLFLNIIFYKDIYDNQVMQVLERLIFSLFFAFIIFDQCFSDASLFKLGRWKFTNYFGNASFGLYCFHGIVISIFTKLAETYAWKFSLWQVSIFNPLILLLLTLVMSFLSYELLEKHIIKLKAKFYSLNPS
ncbi:MAG: acyltransferase [Bacteroidetes bacterium]|nr:acyltransferase [Bacteroidota bacterium]